MNSGRKANGPELPTAPKLDRKDLPAEAGAALGKAVTEILPQRRFDPTLRSRETPANLSAEQTEAALIDDDGSFAVRYVERSLLGQGGMGEVRLSKDHRIGREVAMKVIRGDEETQLEMQPRFLREARVQGQLEHPSIVPVYDLGRHPTGALYFTMKRVRGLTLEDILDGLREDDAAIVATYTRRKLLSAFSSVCLAVHFAHSRGVLHRDLKPGNLMLGDFGEVYVLDWGLAKFVTASGPQGSGGAEEEGSRSDGDAGDKSSLLDGPEGILGASGQTVQGSVMGTPGYMSPEQIQGESTALDARSDVYALGSILFELLTWERLHPQSGTREILLATLVGADARPSVRAPLREVPPELETICVKATALLPADRYPSARELNAAIERFLDGDRDVERRRELAQQHAQAAADSVERVREGAPASERSHAIREVGRSLALDPGNPDAMRSLVRLFSEAPREVPAQVKEEIRAHAVAAQRLGARVAAYAYSSWFLYVPFAWWMGIRNGWVHLVGGLWLVAILACLYVERRPNEDGHTPMLVVIASALAVCGTALMFSPLFFLPTLATANTLSFMTNPFRERRMVTVVIGCMGFVVPLLAELLGWLPPSFSFAHGNLTLLPRVVEFPLVPTLVFLTLANIAMIITPALFLGRLRDDLTLEEERRFLQVWQLQQLMPEDAQGGVAPPAPSPFTVCTITPHIPSQRHSKRRPRSDEA